MKHKRIIPICITLLLIFVMVLTGCRKKNEEPITSQTETTTEKKQQETTTKKSQETTAEATTAESATADPATEEAIDWMQENDPGYYAGDTYFTGYSIWVNLAYCTVTVYECYSDGGQYPIRSMACSCGRAGQETPEGVFYTSDKYEWGYMADGSWGAYVTRFNGDILFHSVPSWAAAPGNIEIGEYNKLGGPASLGCIRLCVADAAWIYYNMPWGTQVVVYTDYSSAGPWGIPGAQKVPDDIPQVRQWDPTDPDPGNPWPYYTISIAPDNVSLPAGSSFETLYNALSITDNYGNSVKHYAYINTDAVDFSTPGSYDVYISIYLGSSYAEKYISVTITE